MIFLDVTSSCKSPMNTGVQRVVRSLYRALAARTAVLPLIWDPGLASYCTLSARERGFLEHPFSGAPASDAEPGRRANPVPVWSKFARRMVHRWNRLDLAARLTPTDALFVPEIFQDNRIPFLAGLRGESQGQRVAVCYDLLNVRYPELMPSSRQAGFEAYLETLSTFGHTVAISQQTADALTTFWRERGRSGPAVSVHYLPVVHAGDVRPISPPPAATACRSVLCVGTFEPRKNHLGLLDAATRLWQRGVDFELLLIGRTTPQHGARVQSTIETLQTAGRPVRWLRHVDDDTLRRAYAECAFTVFPSFVEGFGLPILESLWHGRPCVCGTNGALGEVSAGGGCLAVDQSDPASLAHGMEILLTDPPAYQRICDEAQAREFETWDAWVSRLLPLCRPPEVAESQTRSEI